MPDDRLMLHDLDNSVEAELTLGPASAANLAARGVVLKNLLGDPKTSRWFKTIRVSYQLFDRNAPNMG